MDISLIFLHCDQPKTTKWSIIIDWKVRLISIGGKIERKVRESTFASNSNYTGCGWDDFIKWEDMKKNFMTDGNITIETHVKIEKMTGIERKKLRNFDSEMNVFSDVILTVKNENFYVSKLFLAAQSTYFEALLSKKHEKSEKPKYELDGCKSEDFQYFLELIYGESPIDDETIDKIVHLADKYKAPTAIRKCEEFLMNNSGKSLKEKLRMAKSYKLENLKMSCLSRIKNVADIRSVLSYNVNEMDPSVVAALLQKAVTYLP